KDHRGLHCWREAREVNLAVLRLSRDHWRPYAAAAFSQLQRASLSVQLNIAEGYTFGSSPSFTKHLAIAFGSAVETIEIIELLKETEMVEQELVSEVLRRARLSRKLLTGILKQRSPFSPLLRPSLYQLGSDVVLRLFLVLVLHGDHRVAALAT